MVCNTSVELVITAERIIAVVFHNAVTLPQLRQLIAAGWPITELPDGTLICSPRAVHDHAIKVGYDPGHPERSARRVPAPSATAKVPVAIKTPVRR
jgi:hypothetical protein